MAKPFARISPDNENVVEMPNLLALVKKSYQWFLDTGLREALFRRRLDLELRNLSESSSTTRWT